MFLFFCLSRSLSLVIFLSYTHTQMLKTSTTTFFAQPLLLLIAIVLLPSTIIAQPTSCPAGQYDAGNVCAPCPNGQVCPGGTSQPITCASGQNPNKLSQATACITALTTCNPGSVLTSGLCFACTNVHDGACLGGTAQQAHCSSGFSTTSDMTSCITTPTSCSIGSALQNLFGQNGYQGAYCYFCNSTGSAPFWSFSASICPDGINNNGCPQSSVANYLATACVSPVNTCPSGQFVGSQTCRPCPLNGYACPGGSVLPILCGTGKVPSADKTMCIWDGSSTCNPGTYPLDVYTSGLTIGDFPLCVPCPPFTFCPGGLDQPKVCPAGKTPNANISATACVTTTSCPPGQYINNGACWICPKKYFCAGGSSQPASCPSGMHPADADGNTGASYSFIFGASQCLLPSFCNAGYFGNATGCWECLPGFTCTGGSYAPAAIANYPPSTCQTYSYLSGNKCINCGIGNFNCPGGTAPPQTFPSGISFSDVAWRVFRGSQSRLPYQPASNTGTSLRFIPKSCPLGQFLNTDPLAGCSIPSSDCTPLGCNKCPPGYSCAGGTSAPAACANGLVSNWNTTLGPIGSSCVQPDFSCPPGYVSTTVYSHIDNEVVNKAGHFVYTTSYGYLADNGTPFPKCMECPFGNFQSICPGGNVPAIKCPTGFSIDPTAPNSRCIPTPTSCPPGYKSITINNWPYYWPAPGIICSSCAGSNDICLGGPIPAQATSCSGTDVPNANNTLCIASPASSTLCNPGTYYVTSNGNPYNGYCLPCPTGYGCAGGYLTYLDKFSVRCGPGKAPTANSSICLWDGVSTCPPGQWGTSASRFDDPYCNLCPVGAICAGGSALPVGCPFGQGPNPSATACSVQTTCNPGYYLTNGRCSLCLPGYSCAGGTAAPSLCSTRLVPVDADGEPAIVMPSKFSVLGDVVNNAYEYSIKGGFPAVSCALPLSCPPGTYMNLTTGFEGCTSCPAGFACPGELIVPIACIGSNIGLPPSAPATCGLLSSVSAPWSCSIGYYLPSGGKYCEPCTPGVGCGQPCNQWSVYLNGQCTYVGSNATTCNAGKYLSTDLKLSVCIDCPLNSKCPGGTTTFSSCPVGTVPNIDASDCIALPTSCPVGTSAFWKRNPITFPTGYLWTWGGFEMVTPTCATCDSSFSCPGGYAPPRLCPDNSVPDLTTGLCRPQDTSCSVGYTLISLSGGTSIRQLFDTTFLGDWSNSQIAGTSTSPKRCEKCEASYRCPAGSVGTPQNTWTCNYGTQKNQNETLCVPFPNSCPRGQAPLYGACSTCPTGYYCPGGSNLGYPPASNPVLCGTGKAPNAGATACVWDGATVCAAGTYIYPSTVYSTAYCASCPATAACIGGSSAPTPCAAGQYVNGASSACLTPTSCNAGDYVIGSTGCYPCTSGSICAGGSAAPVACSSGQVPNVAKTACVTGASTCTSGNFLYKAASTDSLGVCLTCPVVAGITGINCGGGSFGLNCGDHINLGYTCLKCPPDYNTGYCGGRNIICRDGYMLDSIYDCVPKPPGPCEDGHYLNSTISGLAFCQPCPTGKYCSGGGALASTCPIGSVPSQVKGSKTCVYPATSCTSPTVLTNGICVNPSYPLATYDCTGTPSATLVSKCVNASIAGGVNATAFFQCGASGSTYSNDWQCIVKIAPVSCSATISPALNTAATSLCGSAGVSCVIQTQIGDISFRGNGVSGGGCTGGGGGGGSGSCVTPQPSQACICSNGNWQCGGGGGSCALPANQNAFVANCSTPGYNVQCLSGAYRCAPATSCPVNQPPLCNTAGQAICISGGNWTCPIIYTCANTAIDTSMLCQGNSLSCNSTCTNRFCYSTKVCPAGQYLDYPTATSTSGYTGICISPASGSLSCPSGQFLVSSPFLFTLPANSLNKPPAQNLTCAPCPSGYTCDGGSGASAWALNPGTTPSTCPSTGTGFTQNGLTSPLGGLSSVIGYPGSIAFSPTSTAGNHPGANVSGRNICIVTPTYGASNYASGYQFARPYISCDANFYSFTVNGALSFPSTYCIPCPSGTYSPGGFVRACSLCSGNPPAYGSCPTGQSISCSGGNWACRPTTGVCAASACVAGTNWSSTGSSPCTACTACSGSVTTACTATTDTVCASAPASCVAGSTWSNAGTVPCAACTACSGSVTTACIATADTVCASAPASCVAGSTWSNAGTAPCAACTACSGSVTTACIATADTVCASAPASCVAGSTWSNAGTAPCAACTTCSGANSVVTSACTTTANTVCGPPAGPTSCPVGQYVSGSTCTWCPAGTYQSSSSFTGSSCTSCPSGTFGLGGSTTASCTGTLTCAAGNYSLPGATSVDITNPTVCVSCASGLTSPSGSTSSAACVTPVSSCNAGEYLSGSACVTCPVGTYQNASSFTGTSCTSCPSGISTTNSATGSTDISACTICAPGYAGTVTGSGTGSASGCTICPVGKYSLASASTCTDCPAGTWGSTTGLTSASCSGSLSCNAGTYALSAAQSNTLSSTSVCEQCPAGTISTAGITSSSQCSTCGLGKYSTAGSSSCTDCPAGTWGATSGLQNASCTGTCAPGKYSAAGSSSCIDCASGLTSPSGSTSSSACVTPSASCNAGSYLSGSACVLCPAGTYQSSSSFTGSSCTACPSGISSTNSATGGTSISVCTICAPGYAGTVQCPPIYANTAVCAGTSLASGCTICPLGKYALASASTCSNCPGGTWGATTGLTSASCTGTCGLGKYSTAGSSSCTDCPAGTWGSTSGLQSASCSGTCPAGKYSTIGSSVCTDCPAGLTSLPGSTSSSACVTPASSCNAGSYLDQSTCVLCPAGTYQSLSSFTGSSCTSCPSGISTTSSATGSISVSDCTICAPGYAGSVTGSGTSGAAGCTICGLGKYSLASASSCANCPAGTWGETTGLTTSACSGICAAGNYSTAGSSSCSLCPAGRWGATPGMQGSGCSGVCADGKYATAGSSSCSDCPAGTWGIRGGVWNAPIGLTNASCSGTCPAGTTSAAAATASNWCSACTSGKYALSGDPTCTLCPAGTWGQTIGLKTPACSGTCPAGKYSAAGAFMCSNCPSGQTSPPGSTSINACVPAVSCVAGSTWSSAGIAPCTACSTCSGANSVVTSVCTATSNTVCGAPATCVAGSTWSNAGTAPCTACATCSGNAVVTSACTAAADTVCSSSGPNSCVAGSTWSSTGSIPCTACSTCPGPNRIVSTTCKVNADSICGCDSGSTVDSAGTGCLPTAVVVMPYSISSPNLCSAAGVVDSVLKPTSGVALSLRGNLSVALGIPSSATFIVAVTACDSTTTLVAQNAPINTAPVPGGIARRRLQTAALNTSSLSLLIDGQTLVITLGFTIPNSVAPAMSAFLSASMSGTASPATMATLASNLQQSIQSSGAASSPQLNMLLSDISSPSSSSSSSNAANAFSKRLNSVPVSAAAPMAASLGVSVASLGITNNTVKGVPSAIAVTGNPLAVAPTTTKGSESVSAGLGGLGALVLLVILPACGYYFLVYRKKKQQGEEKKQASYDSDSSRNGAIDSADISFDVISPMRSGGGGGGTGGESRHNHHKDAGKASFEPKQVDAISV
jgi:hypothetical protein